MVQSRLTDLSILHIERELSEKIDFDEVIKKFAQGNRKTDYF